MKNTPKKRLKDEKTPLYQEIVNHPNITIENKFKADHSKFYVFDDEKIILGGINIEDKENGKDMQNRVYQDYMIMIEGASYVEEFYKILSCGSQNDTIFRVNTKLTSPYSFHMYDTYLNMIKNAKREICIAMAYFSPIKAFIKEIVNAYNRGVKITIVVPFHANYQNDTNHKTVKNLMRKTNNEIDLFFTPKMAHTKLVIVDDYFSFGSTNITKKAFNQLSELNVLLKLDTDVGKEMMNSFLENKMISQKVSDYREIKYNKVLAFLEGFLV